MRNRANAALLPACASERLIATRCLSIRRSGVERTPHVHFPQLCLLSTSSCLQFCQKSYVPTAPSPHSLNHIVNDYLLLHRFSKRAKLLSAFTQNQYLVEICNCTKSVSNYGKCAISKLLSDKFLRASVALSTALVASPRAYDLQTRNDGPARQKLSLTLREIQASITDFRGEFLEDVDVGAVFC